ncbi:hypothetical protein DQ04_12601010 [Trypanosoma grayi]|uniref:hypothetical protein n=1 Tax=Trypanosoma grayi TaxID=71804 RepID=UPI0004F4AF67|nr:hypothetical protein DQ04_12601010 [Trypanosoma grayi]KEG06714.1 hypothetical protein DQ04_12601010 [Trypanosoma grayi]
MLLGVKNAALTAAAIVLVGIIVSWKFSFQYAPPCAGWKLWASAGGRKGPQDADGTARAEGSRQQKTLGDGQDSSADVSLPRSSDDSTVDGHQNTPNGSRRRISKPMPQEVRDSISRGGSISRDDEGTEGR